MVCSRFIHVFVFFFVINSYLLYFLITSCIIKTTSCNAAAQSDTPYRLDALTSDYGLTFIWLEFGFCSEAQDVDSWISIVCSFVSLCLKYFVGAIPAIGKDAIMCLSSIFSLFTCLKCFSERLIHSANKQFKLVSLILKKKLRTGWYSSIFFAMTGLEIVFACRYAK